MTTCMRRDLFIYLEKEVLGGLQGPFLLQNSRILKNFKDILLTLKMFIGLDIYFSLLQNLSSKKFWNYID